MYRALIPSLMAGLLATVTATTALASPFCLPPAAADPAMLRVAPEPCLFYLSWNGAATPDANSPNQTEQLLAEPEIQALIGGIERELLKLLEKNLPPDPQTAEIARIAPGLVRSFLTRPVAFYVSRAGVGPMGPEVQAGLVIHTGPDKAKAEEGLALLESAMAAQLPPGMALQPLTVAGATLKQVPTPPGAPQVAFGFKGDYLLLAVGAGEAESLVGRLNPQGKIAPWLEALYKQLPVDRPGLTFHVNVAGILQAAGPLMDPQVGKVLDATGLGQVTGVSYVSGFDKVAMASQALVSTKGTPSGVLALVAANGLTAKDLQPIPGTATSALVARMDMAAMLDTVLEIAGNVDPAGRTAMESQIEQADQAIGFSIQGDLLQALGDTWWMYSEQPKAGEAIPAVAMGVNVRDRARLESTHKILFGMLQAALSNPDLGGGKIEVKESKYKGFPVFYVNPKTPLAPNVPLAPAWCITDDRFVVASSAQVLKDVLRRDSDSSSLAQNEAVAQRLATESPAVLVYEDTAATVRSTYPAIQNMVPVGMALAASQGITVNLPPLPKVETLAKHALPSVLTLRRAADGIRTDQRNSIPLVNSQSLATSGVAVALLLPAVQAAREAARRSQESNNLKQVGLAMHNFHDIYSKFPATGSVDKDGKPLLSWRVHILPYLEQQALYQQFHLDEPWDSPHNKQLIATMPAVYAHPNLPELQPEGKTVLLAPVGESTLLNEKTGTSIASITDGTSNTIMVVEAAADRAVIWTKPDDLQVDSDDPLDGLGGIHPGGFLALFGDGSVRFLSDSIDPATLWALFTRDKAEVVGDF